MENAAREKPADSRADSTAVSESEERAVVQPTAMSSGSAETTDAGPFAKAADDSEERAVVQPTAVSSGSAETTDFHSTRESERPLNSTEDEIGTSAHSPPVKESSVAKGTIRKDDKHFTLDSLRGVTVERVSDGVIVDLGVVLKETQDKTLVVFGTYAADFNCIEYAQRVRFYLPSLKQKGVKKVLMIVNGTPQAAKKLANLIGLQEEVVLLSDPVGSAGRAFGVCRGWLPEDEINPYLKLFGMLWGLGAWATLPSVVGGYIGNPWGKQPWIESALLQGQLAGRWPNNVIVLDDSGNIKENKFATLKYVGGWGRRPLELATLRLQNMIGVSLQNWSDLKPSDDSLRVGVLTQLGGCMVIEEGGSVKFIWRDQGICHVANFEAILKKI